eukprot:scpid72764/ scgid28319/ 
MHGTPIPRTHPQLLLLLLLPLNSAPFPNCTHTTLSTFKATGVLSVRTTPAICLLEPHWLVQVAELWAVFLQVPNKCFLCCTGPLIVRQDHDLFSYCLPVIKLHVQGAWPRLLTSCEYTAHVVHHTGTTSVLPTPVGVDDSEELLCRIKLYRPLDALGRRTVGRHIPHPIPWLARKDVLHGFVQCLQVIVEGGITRYCLSLFW